MASMSADAVPPEDSAPPVLVVRRRANAVESLHRGWAVLWQDDRARAWGNPNQPVFTRSCTKPFQALAFVSSGAADRFGCTDAEIALACASHNGEPEHRELAARMLARAGLGEAALRCGRSEPFGEKARREFLRRGDAPAALVHNCSGKHAAFLLTQVHLGGDPADYLNPDSPVQRLARESTARVMNLTPEALGFAVDGCSAPTFRPPLAALAAAFARLANPELAPSDLTEPLTRISEAIGRHPFYYSGTGRLCLGILKATGGRAIPKNGAEGVYALGVRGARAGFAVKVEDGHHAGYEPLVVKMLRELGLVGADAPPELARFEQRELKNAAGIVVGRTDAVAAL
jgi:L-asparaginase II